MKPFAVLLLFAALSGCSAYGRGSGAKSVDARTAFEALRGVEGDWSGEVLDGPWINEGAGGEGVEQDGEARPVEGRYHVTAGGSVVEATMFKGTPREMVMMFHLDNGKLLLTQYGLGEDSTKLSADILMPTTSDAASDVAPRSSREPDGVGIRFLRARGANPAPSDDEYLHHVTVFIRRDMTGMFWTFYKDGAPTRVVSVELTQKSSPQAAAAAIATPPIIP